jgi:hypothetical protein
VLRKGSWRDRKLEGSPSARISTWAVEQRGSPRGGRWTWQSPLGGDSPKASGEEDIGEMREEGNAGEVGDRARFTGVTHLVRDVDGVDTLHQSLGVLRLGVSTDHDLDRIGRLLQGHMGEGRGPRLTRASSPSSTAPYIHKKECRLKIKSWEDKHLEDLMHQRIHNT